MGPRPLETAGEDAAEHLHKRPQAKRLLVGGPGSGRSLALPSQAAGVATGRGQGGPLLWAAQGLVDSPWAPGWRSLSVACSYLRWGHNPASS